MEHMIYDASHIVGFSGAKVLLFSEICKREGDFYGDFGVFAGNSGKG
jgi:hypothetical protein